MEPQPRLCVIRWASMHESVSSDMQGKDPLPPLQCALQLDGGAGGALIVARVRAHSISWVKMRLRPRGKDGAKRTP